MLVMIFHDTYFETVLFVGFAATSLVCGCVAFARRWFPKLVRIPFGVIGGVALACVLAMCLFPSVARIERLYYKGHDQFYWGNRLQSEVPEERQEAATALAALLTSSKSTVRQLVIQDLGDCRPEEREIALNALLAFARDENENEFMRQRAEYAIGLMFFHHVVGNECSALDREPYQKMIVNDGWDAAVQHLMSEAPIHAQYLGSRKGKPPQTIYSLRVTLENRENEAVWLILPYWGDKPLPDNGIFLNEDLELQPFGGKGFNGEGGSAVEVVMYGGDGFKAYRLPAQGRLELDDYRVEANKNIGEIVVIEARELKVNGNTPLEKWLPYSTISGMNVKVGSDQLNIEWKNLDWDPAKLGSRGDYPKERVQEVKAEGLRSWIVRFRQVSEK